MGDEMRITVIATGFERPLGARRPSRRVLRREKVEAGSKEMTVDPEQLFEPATFDIKDVDLPTFLRRR